MSKSFRIQENVYNTFLKLKSRKKQQLFLEKCFIYAWENREIESDYDVDLAFSGVKPSIKLSNNGGGLNNPTGINGVKLLKNNDTGMSVCGQSDVSVRSECGQSFISNKYKDISNKNKDIRKEDKEEKTFLVEVGKFFIEDDEKYCNGYCDLARKLSEEKKEEICMWFLDKFDGQYVKLSFIRNILNKAIMEK